MGAHQIYLRKLKERFWGSKRPWPVWVVPETGLLARKALALLPEDAQFYRALTSMTLEWSPAGRGRREAIEVFRQVYEWGKGNTHYWQWPPDEYGICFEHTRPVPEAMQLCTEAFTFSSIKRETPSGR